MRSLIGNEMITWTSSQSELPTHSVVVGFLPVVVGLMASIDHQYHVPHLLLRPVYLTQNTNHGRSWKPPNNRVFCMDCDIITPATLLELFLSSPPLGAFQCAKIFDIGFGNQRRYCTF